MQERAEFKTLYAAYRRAWCHFVVEVEAWQSGKPEKTAVQEPAAALQQAEILYRQSRNELADYMLSQNSKRLSNAATLHGELKPPMRPVHLSGSGYGSSLPAA
jgi:hypothetical protein